MYMVYSDALQWDCFFFTDIYRISLSFKIYLDITVTKIRMTLNLLF